MIRFLRTIAGAVLVLSTAPAAAIAAEAATWTATGSAAVSANPEASSIGSSACLVCHADREDFKSSLHAKTWPREKGIEGEKSCETCHGPGSRHAEAAGDRANPGFATIRNPSRMGAKEGSAMCMGCHEGRARIHWDGSVHETRGVGCLDCHAVHQGHPRNLRAESVQDVCVKCHKNLKAEFMRMSHHPVREGKMTCSDCHNPHGTAGPKLLVEHDVNDTCYKCHAEKRGPFLHEHRPVGEDCTICHVPHGSVHTKLLRERSPFMCQSCHSGSRHPGTIYAANPATPGANLDQRINNRILYRGCLNCHANIHGSNHPSGEAFLR